MSIEVALAPDKSFDTAPNHRLRKLLEEFGYTQDEVAKRIGRNFTTINKYASETNPREIPEAILLLLQAKLGFSQKYISKGTGPRLVKSNFVDFVDLPLITPDKRVAFSRNEVMPTRRMYDRTEAELSKSVILAISMRDHMGEQLKPATMVLSRLVEEADWDTLIGIVAVVTQSGIDIKRIVNNSLPVSKTLTLQADSPKGGSYVLNRSAIQSIYQLLTIIDSPVE